MEEIPLHAFLCPTIIAKNVLKGMMGFAAQKRIH